jgi:hypothetical protein
MSYAETWFSISSRIKGLKNSGELYALFQSYHAEDNYGAGNFLREQCVLACNSIRQFRKDFDTVLPIEAKASIDHFLSLTLATAANDASTGARGARGALVGLAALEAEITFLLSGREELIRIRSERALLHLQRSIAVDDAIATVWQNALTIGEVACEKLGSVHLLSHGIYAFKVNAAGARTDLVFGEAPEYSEVTRAVEGLVLTEWKVAKDGVEAAKKFVDARNQSNLYKDGALAGIELRGYRYLIVVSLSEIPKANIPADLTISGVTYRHVNIVVQPVVPSKAAIKK